MIRRHGNFYRRFMRWQNLWDLRFCRKSTQRMTKKYTRRLQKKAMRLTIFSCRDWSLMRLRTGGAAWAKEIVEKKISTVNMLGCHDGIPLLDLKGLLPKEEIQSLIDRIVSRGGMVKNLHGQKNLYYQVNATYYSALGESDEKMLLARAIQMFMPGKPQIWYLDLFAGKNDHEAVQRAGESGHKEINRTNLSGDQIAEGLKKDVVQKQLALIRMRNTHKAFSEGAEVTISGEESSLEIRWEYDGAYAELHVNFEEGTYTIESN